MASHDPASSGTNPAAPVSAAEDPDDRLRPLSEAELDALPRPTWVVDGVIPSGGLAVMYGDPKVGKTFLAIAAACCVSLGRPWLSRKVICGNVVYIVGEGIGFMQLRKDAWKLRHDVRALPRLYYVRGAVDLLQDAGGLIGHLRRLRPVLVIVDTLARCMPGADEDSARDMGRFVAACLKIQEAVGAAVLVIHHPTKRKPTTERGSGALRGASDAMFRVERSGSVLTLISEDQKDGPTFGQLTASLLVQAVEGVSTLVADVDDSVPPTASRLHGEATATLREVAIVSLLTGAADTQSWQKAVIARNNSEAGLSASSFDRIAKQLLGGGVVGSKKVGRKTVYDLTAIGKQVAEEIRGRLYASQLKNTG
jgi:hypothetical protein